MSLDLIAYHDHAGDGWIDLLLPAGGLPIRGFRLDALEACTGSSDCNEVTVFGSSGGGAQEAGWLILGWRTA